MAASLIQSALHVNFDSVLSLSDSGMVSMFKTLESSGLRGFLGCSADIYEGDFMNFFENAFVRKNAMISSVQGMFVEISEDLFAGSFDLPLEGLTSMNGADPKPTRLEWPIISIQKKQLCQRQFVDAFAPICAFIEPFQDINSRRPYSAIFQKNGTEICIDVVQFFSFWTSTASGRSQMVRLLQVQVLQVRLLPAHLIPVILLRASIDQIQFEQVQTRETIGELKAELSQKITKLELAFAQSTSRQDMVFRASLLFVPNSQKSLPISIEDVMKKRGKEVVVVNSLKIEADLLEVEVVESEVNLLREEVVRTEEEGVEVLVLADGFIE
ncbi:mucin-2-like [Dorcoceras hygrometricum]|uniref:Mucin-2-like n=1 Tax=Dorcoceras hygrometricum TaxID=472368 RepID=A0A2Z7B8V9_9LAMI|nr:mucin-2-like [Dorcoceras hygrometricum]